MNSYLSICCFLHLFVCVIECIYDNACTSEAFFLNREPQWTTGVAFRVDALHYKSHKKCSTCYDSSLFHHIKNSSLSEQLNSSLANIKSQGRYMGQFSFLFLVRHFLWELNKSRNPSLSSD